LEDGVDMSLLIKSDIPIPEGSFVEFRSRGMLGEMHLEIVRPSPIKDLKLLETGDTLDVNETQNDLSTLIAKGSNIADDIKRFTEALGNLSDQTEFFGDLSVTMKEFRKFSEQISSLTSDQGSLKASIEDAKEIIALFKDSYSVYDARIHKILAHFQETFRETERLFVTKEKMGGLEALAESLHHLKALTADAKQIMSEVKQGKGTVGALLRDKKVESDVKEISTQVRSLVDGFDKIQLNFQYQGDFSFLFQEGKPPFNFKESYNQFNLILRTSPTRAYLLGLNDSSGLEKYRVRYQNLNENPNYEYEYDRIGMGFNAQIVQTFFSSLNVNFGLFHNRAGLAIESYFNDGRVSIGAEATEFNLSWYHQNPLEEELGPMRLKLWSRLKLENGLFLVGGVDRIFQYEGFAPFLGAGFYFQDPFAKQIVSLSALTR
jgi:phospholipid/cholesterol/gamma-HCH transport system substrate-binding protein